MVNPIIQFSLERNLIATERKSKMIDISRPKLSIFDKIVPRRFFRILGLREKLVDDGLQTLLGGINSINILLEQFLQCFA